MPRGKNTGRVNAGARSLLRSGRLAAGWTLLALVLALGDPPVFSGPQVDLLSTRLAQGDSASVVIRAGDGTPPRVLWMGNPVYLVPGKEAGSWIGFYGADLTAEPGPAPLVVESGAAGGQQAFEITIVTKDRGVRVLTLPQSMVELDAKTLKRVKKESNVMKKVLGAPPAAPLWQASFVKPLEGDVVGVFGTRSVINGQPRSPHSGVDLRAAAGTPVKSIQHGRVVLVADHFFSGKTVVIDHGGAIQSMYFHLEKTLIKEQDKVKQGQVIGLVGSTGRSTGPHLHFGMRVNGARVDPMQFLALSEQAGRP